MAFVNVYSYAEMRSPLDYDVGDIIQFDGEGQDESKRYKVIETGGKKQFLEIFDPSKYHMDDSSPREEVVVYQSLADITPEIIESLSVGDTVKVGSRNYRVAKCLEEIFQGGRKKRTKPRQKTKRNRK